MKQLFYRRARGKSIVRLDSESDISALLDEYPLRHPTGNKKSERCIMYLAADLENINGKRQLFENTFHISLRSGHDHKI